MSESPTSETPALTAGALLRQARLAKGLHIAALATSIKVAPRKLELLEADRFDELPGATFTRALAQTVCRSLKIDAAPVLALLPLPAEQGLAQMSMGLNAPFRDRPGRRVPNELQFLRNPVVLGAAGLLVAAVLVYLLPAAWINDKAPPEPATAEPPAATLPAPAFESASAVLPAASAVVETLQLPFALPASVPAASAPAAAQPSPASAPVPVSQSGALLLRASAESWVEVIDGRGAALMSRLLQPGETVGLDGASPLRLRIGNASATRVTFKGKAVDLAPTRDNVVKLELR